MGSLTRMASKCRNCSKKETCDKKKMEACACIEKSNCAGHSTSIGLQNAVPNLRETVTINVGGVLTNVYKDDIAREISKTFSEQFSVNCCR